MSNNFSMTAKSEYDLFNNNCATAVQKAMLDALVIRDFRFEQCIHLRCIERIKPVKVTPYNEL